MSLAAQKTNSIQAVKEQVVDKVTQRVESFIQSGRLHLPKGYSAHNAMHAAWLILQEVQTKDKRPALEACTRTSIANALFRMVVQGLDPMKAQCYFIAYGNHLSCQRSYFGAIAIAQRMAGVAEVLPVVRYEGEEFQVAIERGRYVVERHVPSIDRKPGAQITHAYCVVEYADGRPPTTEIMTWDQIKASWKKSRGNPNAENSPHREQPDQMAIRTVVNRALKRPINASTDEHLAEVLDEIERSDAIAEAESEIEVEAGEHANRTVLELEPEVIDIEAAEASEPTGEPAAEPGF